MKHLKLLIFLLGILSYGASTAQTSIINLKATALRNNKEIKKGTEVNLVKFTHETVRDERGFYSELFYLEDSKGRKVNVDRKLDDTFDFQYKNIQDFWDASIINNVLYSLKKYGYQYELRKEMEDDALSYIQKVKEFNLVFNDPYLENYIYSLTAKIAPERLIDGRPSNINILIQQNPAINACTYPNGTIILNTGLLSILHTEDELIAVLAHEIAHYVLDHTVINVNKEKQRIKRAEFWTAVLTGATAVAEGVAASKNKYYLPGAATIGVAALSTSIADQVIERLGMEYNHEQEAEADELAVKALEYLGYDKSALAAALSRIEKCYLNERNSAIYVASYTHPDLVSRITKYGKHEESDCDKSFEQKVSFAVTNLAAMKYEDKRFSQCMELVSQNIRNNVATSDDYILKAKCLLALRNTPESNTEVLKLINKAKEIGTRTAINIYSTEIIANLRLNKKEAAVNLLNEYLEKLKGYESSMNQIQSAISWESFQRFTNTEADWAKRMLVKLKGMI